MLKKSGIPILFTSLLVLPFIILFSQVGLDDLNAFNTVFFSETSVNTFSLIILSGFFACLWSIPSAYIQSKYKIKGFQFLNWTLMLPLALPAYIAAYTYKGIFGPFGTTHDLFGFFLEIDQLFYLSLIFSFVLYPYLFIILKNHFRYQNKSLVEAAQSLGKSKLQSFISIRIPLMIPAVISGVSIIAMEILNNFGAVSYYGISTYTTEIIQKWSPVDTSESVGISLALLLSVGLIFGIDYFYKRKRHFVEQGLQFNEEKPHAQGKIKYIGIFSQLIPFLFGFLIPVVQLAFWATKEYTEVLDQEFYQLIFNTLILAGKAIVFCVLIALIFSYFLRFYPSKFNNALAKLSTVGYAFPGVVVAIAVLQLAKGSEFLGINFTNYLSVFLVFAYMIRFQAISLNGIKSSLEKIPFTYHEASNSLGKNRWQSILHIEWPLIKSAIFAAILMIFVDVSKELPLTMMFQTFNFETLAIRSYLLMITDGAVYQSSVPSLIIVGIGLIPALFLNKMSE